MDNRDRKHFSFVIIIISLRDKIVPMKKVILLLFFINATFAQNETHQNVVNTFIMDFNVHDYEKIYQSFSPKLQKSRSKKYFFDIFKRVQNVNGTIQNLDLITYRENSRKTSQAKYNAIMETGTLSMEITVNSEGIITGIYIRKNTTYL